MYPYRVRIIDPEIAEVMRKVSKYRYCKVKPHIAHRLGYKIPRKIKRDGVIIKDGIFTIYNPVIKLDFKPAYGKRKGYDFEFKTMF